MFIQISGPLHVNSFIIPTSDTTCMIIDPGGNPQGLNLILHDNKLVCTHIILTHGHLDHTVALPELLLLIDKPAPKICIHQNDADYLGSAAYDTNKRIFTDIGAQNYFNRYFKVLPSADIFLQDNDEIVPNWRIIHTPGHTKGSICLYNADKKILISGDTLFKGGRGRTDSFDSNDSLLVSSIKNKLFTLEMDVEVFPGHGQSTTIGKECSF